MLGVKEYAAGKKELDPALGVKVSVKTGAGRPVARTVARPVARRLYEPVVGGLVVVDAQRGGTGEQTARDHSSVSVSESPSYSRPLTK